MLSLVLNIRKYYKQWLTVFDAISFGWNDMQCIGKGKGRILVFFGHAMKAYRESRGITPLIPNFDPRWRRVVNFCWSGHFGKEKNLFPLRGFRNWTT
jgi:hypothetical protein